jgi:chromosome segregation ATPase
MKAILAVLAVVVAGLCWALYDTRTNARDRREADALVIGDYSNRWVEIRALFEEQQRVNTSLNSTLDVRNAELHATRGRLSDVSATLARTEAEKAADKKKADEEIARRDGKIASLESRNDDLGKQMVELNTSIEGLEQQIAATEQKLAQSEGDKQALLAELTRLRAEKARLETQLNDLAFLRDQVRKLKDELSLARRLDWIRRGIYGNAQKKGAERMQELAARAAAAPAAPAGATGVELRQDGSITVTTNAAPPAPR